MGHVEQKSSTLGLRDFAYQIASAIFSPNTSPECFDQPNTWNRGIWDQSNANVQYQPSMHTCKRSIRAFAELLPHLSSHKTSHT
jgi:hypothetical protein